MIDFVAGRRPGRNVNRVYNRESPTGYIVETPVPSLRVTEPADNEKHSGIHEMNKRGGEDQPACA